MGTKVSITAEDIVLGKKSSRGCPFALALRRVFPTLSVNVGSDYTLLGDNAVVYEKVDHTPELRAWIGAFDHDWSVEPITVDFPYELPQTMDLVHVPNGEPEYSGRAS